MNGPITKQRCKIPGNSIIIYVNKTRNTCAIRRHRPKSSFEILEREAAHACLVTMRLAGAFPNISFVSCWSDQSMLSFSFRESVWCRNFSYNFISAGQMCESLCANFSRRLMDRFWQNFEVCSNIKRYAREHFMRKQVYNAAIYVYKLQSTHLIFSLLNRRF